MNALEKKLDFAIQPLVEKGGAAFVKLSSRRFVFCSFVFVVCSCSLIVV